LRPFLSRIGIENGHDINAGILLTVWRPGGSLLPSTKGMTSSLPSTKGMTSSLASLAGTAQQRMQFLWAVIVDSTPRSGFVDLGKLNSLCLLSLFSRNTGWLSLLCFVENGFSCGEC
jgi:hypothetical protein